MSAVNIRNFNLGRVVMTRAVSSEIPRGEMMEALLRHASCDWGDLSDRDRQANDLALRSGDYLVSAYHTKDKKEFYIITEWDRSATTVLMPYEY